jgi:hypothetical protein
VINSQPGKDNGHVGVYGKGKLESRVGRTVQSPKKVNRAEGLGAFRLVPSTRKIPDWATGRLSERAKGMGEKAHISKYEGV